MLLVRSSFPPAAMVRLAGVITVVPAALLAVPFKVTCPTAPDAIVSVLLPNLAAASVPALMLVPPCRCYCR